MSFDPKKIRKDFPHLNSGVPHYLDAATLSLAPQQVSDAEGAHHKKLRTNIRRFLFRNTERGTQRTYHEMRKKVAAFINGEPDEITFTTGATESSNILTRALDETLYFAENKELVTTVLEHDGALIPLRLLAKQRDLLLHMVPIKGTALDHAKLTELVSDDTALIATIMASHVTGGMNDIRYMADLAHRHRALLFVDATASVGRVPIDVATLGCDALYFSGHKMFASADIGVLWAKRGLLEKPRPSSFGQTLNFEREKVSARRPKTATDVAAENGNLPALSGLCAAIDYVQMLGGEHIRAHIQTLVAHTIRGIEEIPGVVVIAERDAAKNIGIISFCCTWASAREIADMLARDGVAVRAGQHAAPVLHATLGLDASIRASFHCYNTKEDADALINGLARSRERLTRYKPLM